MTVRMTVLRPEKHLLSGASGFALRVTLPAPAVPPCAHADVATSPGVVAPDGRRGGGGGKSTADPADAGRAHDLDTPPLPRGPHGALLAARFQVTPWCVEGADQWTR